MDIFVVLFFNCGIVVLAFVLAIKRVPYTPIYIYDIWYLVIVMGEMRSIFTLSGLFVYFVRLVYGVVYARQLVPENR